MIEAALEAARIRLRPILMTSLAFIFGVLPLAISTGAGANSRIAIGTAVIGGMLTATILAIFYIPLFFVLVRRTTRDALQRAPSSPPRTPSAGGKRMSKTALLLTAALAGCSIAPKYARPEAPVPPSWPVGDAYLRANEAALPAITYRDIFRDPRLQKLIEQALANNRDLRVAAANIAAARAQYRVQRAQQFPQVDASGGVTDDPDNTNGSSGTRTAISADVGVPSFELDLFGRLASLIARGAGPIFRH